jgi:hypothetical protein
VVEPRAFSKKFIMMDCDYCGALLMKVNSMTAALNVGVSCNEPGSFAESVLLGFGMQVSAKSNQSHHIVKHTPCTHTPLSVNVIYT